MEKTVRIVLGMGCVMLLGGTAQARWSDRRPEWLASGAGVAIEGGGGVFGFRGGQLADLTRVGGDWNVRLLFGTRWYLGGELAYVGSATPISVAGINTSAHLVGNGLEGALRVQLPIPLGLYGLIQPYVLGGVGWTRYDLSSGSDVLDRFASGNDGLSVPLGAGLLFGYRHLLLDLRGGYRFGFYNNPVRSEGSSAGTDSWSANVLLGYEL